MILYSSSATVETGSVKGFAVVRQFLTPQGLDEFRSQLEHCLTTVASPWLSKNSAVTETGDYLVVRSIDTPSDFFFQAARRPEIVSLAEQFAAKKVTPLYVEYFNKPPRCVNVSPPHQDHAFYNAHFPDELGVTFWIALDDCDESNGCLQFRPETNPCLLPHIRTNHLGFAYVLRDYEVDDFVPVPLAAGDAVVHGSYTPHYASANVTGRHRRGIAISYRTSDFRQHLCA